jgi:hypothetical protein
MLPQKYGYAYKPSVAGSCYDRQEGVKRDFLPNFFCCLGSSSEHKVWIESWPKQLQKYKKCLKLFKEIRLYLLYLSIDVLEDPERNVRTLKMMEWIGSHLKLEIWKQLQ